jgi:hypothetical protein
VSTLAPPSAAEWLEVIRTGRSDWRVSDSRLASGDPERIVGFVERLDRLRYEVLWMTDPMRWAYVESLAAAVAAIRDRVEFVGPQLLQRQERHPRRGGPNRWEF